MTRPFDRSAPGSAGHVNSGRSGGSIDPAPHGVVLALRAIIIERTTDGGLR
jgi:hypothetical protein